MLADDFMPGKHLVQLCCPAIAGRSIGFGIACDRHVASCHVDPTIAMAILVSAMFEQACLVARRTRPSFKIGRTLDLDTKT